MTIESLQFIEDHNRKQTNKGTAKALTFAFLISGSVIFCQLIASFLIGIITVFIPNLNVDSIYVTLALYLFYIGIPALFGFFIFKSTTNTKKYVFVKRRSPKKPLVFIFGAIGSGFIFNLLVSLLFPSVVEHSEDIGIAASSNSEILLNFLMYAILPAILEEILFRGIILKNLLPYSKSGAIIISALLFGITHMNPIQILFASVFGVILHRLAVNSDNNAFYQQLYFCSCITRSPSKLNRNNNGAHNIRFYGICNIRNYLLFKKRI